MNAAAELTQKRSIRATELLLYVARDKRATASATVHVVMHNTIRHQYILALAGGEQRLHLLTPLGRQKIVWLDGSITKTLLNSRFHCPFKS